MAVGVACGTQTTCATGYKQSVNGTHSTFGSIYSSTVGDTHSSTHISKVKGTNSSTLRGTLDATHSSKHPIAFTVACGTQTNLLGTAVHTAVLL